MNKLIIAIVASTFAAITGAQTPNPKSSATDQEKQKEVDAATKAGSTSTSRIPAEQTGVDAAKATKHTSKSLPTKADKQKAAEAAGKAGTSSTATMAAEKQGVEAAKATKGTPKNLPTKRDKQKAVQSTTTDAVNKDGSN